MTDTWITKYGPRRVRRDPPTLAEAIAAAQGLTDDIDGQLEIAADLMGVPVAEARAEMRKLMPDRRTTTRTVTAPAMRDKVARTVVVERKTSRRLAARQTGGPQQRGMSSRES